MIAKREAKVLLNSSIPVHAHDQRPYRTTLIELMRKALRPGKTPRSKGFDQLWS